MTSFRLTIAPHRKSASKFVADVHGWLRKAYSAEKDITQTEIADKIGVHRSVISRQMRGQADMSLSRVAEIAHTLGYEPSFRLVKIEDEAEDKWINIFQRHKVMSATSTNTPDVQLGAVSNTSADTESLRAGVS